MFYAVLFDSIYLELHHIICTYICRQLSSRPKSQIRKKWTFIFIQLLNHYAYILLVFQCSELPKKLKKIMGHLIWFSLKSNSVLTVLDVKQKQMSWPNLTTLAYPKM